MSLKLTAFFLVFMFIIRSGFLQIETFIRSKVVEGEDATLSCRLNFSYGNLYSVKWFKDNHEIYRFTPSRKPQKRVFHWGCLKVRLSQSTENDLVLEKVHKKDEGEYFCEVTEEEPSFYTSLKSQYLEVLKNPEDDNDLYNLRVVVPPIVLQGEDVALYCLYDLHNKTLKSVSWYLNFTEIYRYKPLEFPSKQTFITENGPEIRLSQSDTSLTLGNVTTKSSGLYGCQITTESSMGPLMKTSNLEVVTLPKRGPEVILEGRSELSRGSQFNITCISRDSFPPVNLSWEIPDNSFKQGNHQSREEVDCNVGCRVQIRTTVIIPGNFRGDTFQIGCTSRMYDIYKTTNRKYFVLNTS